MGAFIQGLIYYLGKPFNGLSKDQHVLFRLRLGSSVMTLCIAVVLMALGLHMPQGYVAQIHCDHLDVALGLYSSLKSLLTETIIYNGATNSVLPVDLTLTDSEITILSDYAQTQVANAPQYFRLGVSEYCAFSYATNFQDLSSEHMNATHECYTYKEFNFFDYRQLLILSGFQIIIAYAYESNGDQDLAYDARIESRDRNFHIMKVIFVLQFVAQLVLSLCGASIYGNRGPAKDLSRIPPLALNATAFIALLAGLLMLSASVICVVVLSDMQTEIADGLGSYGVSMQIGKLFMALLSIEFAFSCLSMLSWVVPLWCASSPRIAFPDEELFQFNNSSGAMMDDATYVGNSNLLKRQNYASSSRLFDTETMAGTADFDNPFLDDPASLTTTYENPDFSAPQESSSKIHSEYELRKLGEKLTRNTSIRQLNLSSKMRRSQDRIFPQKKDTRELLYGDNPFSNHQYPQPFPRPMDSAAVSRAASLTYTMGGNNALRTRMLLEDTEKQAPPARPKGIRNPFVDAMAEEPHLGAPNRLSVINLNRDDASVLDDEEMKYLDNNHFVNQMP